MGSKSANFMSPSTLISPPSASSTSFLNISFTMDSNNTLLSTTSVSVGAPIHSSVLAFRMECIEYTESSGIECDRMLSASVDRHGFPSSKRMWQ